MSQPAFDPFGEPVPASVLPQGPDRTTRLLKSAGTGIFWTLVAAIVVARAAFFEPGSFSFDRAMAWLQTLLPFIQGLAA